MQAVSRSRADLTLRFYPALQPPVHSRQAQRCCAAAAFVAVISLVPSASPLRTAQVGADVSSRFSGLSAAAAIAAR